MKILFSIVSIFIIILSFGSATFATNSQVKVYTPKAYKQQSMKMSPKYTNVQGDAVELLVDFSGSMSEWIEIAKDALVFILPKIPDTNVVALRVFGERSTVGYLADYYTACQSTRLVSYFKKSNESSIVKGLDEAVLGGMTPIELGLREVVEKDFRSLNIIGPSQHKKKIILVTDGSETCGGNPCEYIKNAARLNKSLQVDVIQLGNNNFLSCLSEATDGNFYTVQTREDFEHALEKTFSVPTGTVQSGKQQGPDTSLEQITKQKQKGYKFIQF